MATRITKKEFAAFQKQVEEKKTADRKSRALEATINEFKGRLVEVVRNAGGIEKSTITCGYRIALETTDGRVKWKDEFIKKNGEKAAVKLQTNAPKGEKLTVQKV